jgi:sec-independent protein translocase protein TatB
MGIPPPIEMANLGMADSLILMALALVVFGPRRLPEIGRQLGKLMYEFRKASNDFKFQMEEELRNAEEADRRKREETARQHTLALPAPEQAAAGETVPQATDAGSAAPGAPESVDTSFYADHPQPADKYQVEEPEAIHPRMHYPPTGRPVARERHANAVADTAPAEAPAGGSGEKDAPAAAAAESPVEAENPVEAKNEAENPVQIEPAPDQNPAAAEPAAHHG